MKKLTLAIIIVLSAASAFAQNPEQRAFATNTQNAAYNPDATYRLFPTQNMWTFIKLNTRNGQLWQVEYDVNQNDRSQAVLSLVPRATKEQEKNGRFTLYPTQHAWTFMLIDQVDGRVWQVQWAKNPEERHVIPVELK